MEYKEFYSTLDNLNNYLDRNGVAVIPNILTDRECSIYRNQIWKELKHVSQDRFDIVDKDTWRQFYNFYPLHSMLLQHFSLGHMKPIWELRQNNKVCEVYEKIWNTPRNDLLVSFDGLSVHLPPEKTNKGWFKNAWYHTDQSFEKPNKCCVQGYINLYDTNENDASLTILEGSHLLHQDFKNEFEIECKDDWYKLNDDERKYFFDKGCNPVAVKAKQGSMVLWDSRTMHQGKEPDRARKKENFRMVAYICMLPRNTSTSKELIKKQKAFENLRVTSHWANKAKLFPKTPRTYGGELLDFNQIHQPELNQDGRRLAGYDE